MCVLSNPPETDGTRTLARVELAREIVSAAEVRVVNLFSAVTHRSGGISIAGAEPDAWIVARPTIERELRQADLVLLAYGLKSPTGPARVHHRVQLAWLDELLCELALPVFVVGEGPRHPSRWQRWTSRHHPGLSFAEAVRRSMVLRA
ncbi:DUF1643 domain-containing protein [Curtobacterium pusillum]|uniref:DUF1643 domain-containing protein n=1 Tax=Curtobacterium pusillum TaxID=69373 RepID=A0ABX2M5C5_9MICO|nr:DUF1643 domain-containing protein [Curtobacterium pusillum]NUU13135.1 DUF1643 domain-containing protein [Curtobacterium pusillum]